MIDWNRVRELRDEIGVDDFTEVVDLFLEEVEDVLDRMRSRPDPANYEADLHFLKGSALNLGFQALSALCRDGELRAAARRLEDADLLQVFRVYESSKRQFMEAQSCGTARLAPSGG